MITACIGVWIIADGVSSIWAYPKQSWGRDHSLRVLRVVLGAALIYLGASA